FKSNTRRSENYGFLRLSQSIRSTSKELPFSDKVALWRLLNSNRGLDDKRKGAADTKDGACLLRRVPGGLDDLGSCGQGQWFVLDSAGPLVCRRFCNRFCVPRVGTPAVRRHWIHSDPLDSRGPRAARMAQALWRDLARGAFVAFLRPRFGLPGRESSLVRFGSLQ